jgi:hypothetical protein
MLSFKSIASLAALCLLPTLAAAQQQPIVVEHGIYQVHLLLHAIGSEEYSITDARDGHHVLTTSTNTDDRGPKRSSVSTRTFGDHFDPLKLEQNSGDVQSTTEISGVKAQCGGPGDAQLREVVRFLRRLCLHACRHAYDDDALLAISPLACASAHHPLQ